jgi:hypothetical protein
MVWIVILVFLPFLVIIGGIVYFNVYLRKQITKDTIAKPTIDQLYLEAEQTKSDDEDMITSKKE